MYLIVLLSHKAYYLLLFVIPLPAWPVGLEKGNLIIINLEIPAFARMTTMEPFDTDTNEKNTPRQQNDVHTKNIISFISSTNDLKTNASVFCPEFRHNNHARSRSRSRNRIHSHNHNCIHNNYPLP